jgi:hypothetical protein
MWESFDLEDDRAELASIVGEPSEQLLLAISKSAVTGCPAPRIEKLLGCIQHHNVSILIDSGSTSSFITESLVQQLSNINTMPISATVRIDSGGILQSHEVIKLAEWVVASYVFHNDLSVLPLAAYDVVIGMDFCEAHRPMNVH